MKALKPILLVMILLTGLSWGFPLLRTSLRLEPGAESDSVQESCKAGITSNAIEVWIDAKQRHHLTPVMAGLFQTVEGLILVAKSQVNDRLAISRNVTSL